MNATDASSTETPLASGIGRFTRLAAGPFFDPGINPLSVSLALLGLKDTASVEGPNCTTLANVWHCLVAT